MSLQKKFEQVLVTNAFEEINPYRTPDAWTTLSLDEKELLGLLLVKEGEELLKKGDSKVLENFQLASEVAAHSPRIFYRQGLVYATQDQNIRCLMAARQALEKAVQLDPKFSKAWHALGNILVRIGFFYDDAAYFQEADLIFLEVEKIFLENPSQCIHDENFYWHWGVCWYFLGKNSEEAVDFYCALQKFRKAAEDGYEHPEFFNDFGNALVELGCLLNRKDLFYEALHFYRKCVGMQPDKIEGWVNLACIYHRLYDLSGNHEFLLLSEEAFEKSAEINSSYYLLWVKWGELYINAFKIQRDVERLRASCEKFEKAYSIEPDNDQVFIKWGEAQMLLGANLEELDLLRESELKIAKALEAYPEDPYIWYIYGLCHSEYGRYFEEENHYLKAIEKFKYALTLNDSLHFLWYGMALAHFAIGELRDDVQMLEKCVHYCNQALEFGGEAFSQFWNDWGVALLKLGELSGEKKHVISAVEKFEQAIDKWKEDFEGESVDLEWLYNYGCALDYLGDFTEDSICYEKAVQVLSFILQQEPEYTHARYNLALALSHLGEVTEDLDCFYKAIGLFQELLHDNHEDDMAWNDWGLTLLNLAALIHDPIHPETSQKIFLQAESKLLYAIALGSEQAFYNLACLHSLMGNYSIAMHYLERAQLCGALPSLDDVMHDEWLDGLRGTPAFRQFITQLVSKQEKEK